MKKWLLILLFYNQVCFSQPASGLRFEHYSSENGLSHRNTNTMMIDSKGFLWVGAFDGLNRFDGYEFKYYGNSPFDTSTVSRAWPWAMAEDKNGNIWVSTTIPQGLNKYDPQSGRFFRYSEKEQYKKILPTSLINQINIDASGNLWLSTNGEGLFKFNPANNTSVRYFHQANDTTTIGSNYPNGVCFADNNFFYIATPTGFDILNLKTEKFRHFNLTKPFIKGDSEQPIYPWCKDHNGILWLATKEGLFSITPSTHEIISFKHDDQKPHSLNDNFLNCILETPDGKLWITTESGGLNVYEPVTKEFNHYLNDTSNPESLSSNDTYDITFHSSGKIFIQTSSGIDAVNLLPARFTLFTHDDKNKNSVSDNGVGAIYRDKANNIFVNTAHGLNIFDPITRKFHLYQPDARINDILRNSGIYFFRQDREGNYWIVADANKVIMFNPADHQLRIFHPEPDNPDSLSLTYIWGIYEDSRGNYWFNGPTHSCRYEPSTGKITRHLIDPAIPDADVNGINMFSEHKGKIWGNSFFGLLYYDISNNTFVHPSFNGHPNAMLLQKNWIFCATQETATRFWLGTEGQGVFFLDIETGHCVNISASDGLPDNVIMSVTKDIHQNLWIATGKGLSKFTPSKELMSLPGDYVADKGKFRNYGTADGLPAREMSNDPPAFTADGYLLNSYFSPEGMTMFHPDSISDNPFIPSVYITAFSLFNKEVFPSDSNKFIKHTIETTKEIILSYRENVISFSFAALNFIHPENNHYAYKLEPFNKDWIYTDATKRFANYTNLDPGEYIFKVKGSNNDGVWNETPTTIKLIITPPYWETWWFRLLVAAIVAAVVYILYRFRINQLMKLQAIRNRIAHDLHDNIGSTLNSISIYSEVAQNKSKEKIPELDLIGESSRKVMDAMSDIVWTINPENDSFEKIIFRMRSHTHLMMKAKNIEYTFKADEKLNELTLPMLVRKNFYLIFKEAVNNLLKYSNATRVYIALNYSDHTVEMLIRDNGSGFDITNPPRGNGLNSMKQRAKEVKAAIKIESEIGNGTSIGLNLKTK